MKVKPSVLIIAIAALFQTGCKKAVENVQEDLMVKLITDNTWVITKYQEGTENKTTDYSNYYFQFYKDWTVDAINNGTFEAKGKWLGSQEKQSITSEFSSVGAPLNKLTGEWIVTNTKSKPWRVYSHRFVNGIEYFLDLQERQ
jgi:hypothetical protein